jgi:C1A family cysteine protease
LKNCGTALDHEALVVGWGTEDGVNYWTMKNSYGTDWGEEGYIRLAITDGDGVCGI